MSYAVLKNESAKKLADLVQVGTDPLKRSVVYTAIGFVVADMFFTNEFEGKASQIDIRMYVDKKVNAIADIAIIDRPAITSNIVSVINYRLQNIENGYITKDKFNVYNNPNSVFDIFGITKYFSLDLITMLNTEVELFNKAIYAYVSFVRNSNTDSESNIDG